MQRITQNGRSPGGFIATLAGILLLAAIAGCEPKIPPEELGTPVYDGAKLPGANDPLPDRTTPEPTAE